MSLIDNPDKSWECWGQRDPYYGVLTCEEYHRAQLSDVNRQAFFASGEQLIDDVFAVIRTHIVEEFHPLRALDFGCGVGRLSIPLAQRCERVVGVDVSPSMLREAERNCVQRGIHNVEFLHSDDTLGTLVGEFDFVQAHLVFQHIPRRRGERLMMRLIDRMALGGVGVMHFVYVRQERWKKQWMQWGRKYIPGLNGMVNIYLNQPWDQPMMQMNIYDVGRLCQIMQDRGCNMLYAQLIEHAKTKSQAIQLFFQKQVLSEQ